MSCFLCLYSRFKLSWARAWTFTCYPDTNLAVAKELMEAKGIKQLPVVKRGVESNKERKRRIIALLHYDSIWNCLRFFDFIVLSSMIISLFPELHLMPDPVFKL
ncbi:hypothetical protein RGQ29_032097 [Quercus rubra]|uniref:Uncharacterized protein n=1 Tax=Quercus rubra TaxID=3512 RepID=A0AAN7HR81_QUERU|nr:hypothetical protein RGQ29_032097 [Quercus rubra]